MDKKVIMHKKSTFGIALFLGLVLCACSCKTISLEVFTHPYNLNQVPTYRSPNKFYSYLQADTEGGWIVEIQKQSEGFFYVKLPSECELPQKGIWLKAGDLGVVVQNYDSIEIPVYLSADTLSVPVTYISHSTTGIICSIKKDFVLLRCRYNGAEVKGWVQKKYLCGNPYTSCN